MKTFNHENDGIKIGDIISTKKWLRTNPEGWYKVKDIGNCGPLCSRRFVSYPCENKCITFVGFEADCYCYNNEWVVKPNNS